MKRHLISALLAVISIGAVAPAYALGKFSRACRFDTLPAGSKGVLTAFFIHQGASMQFDDLTARSNYDQSYYWINEALTTDYFTVRYYLFAHMSIYLKYRPDLGSGVFNFYHSYSSNWSVNQVKLEIRNNPKFSPYYVNRGPTPLYNARAGDPRILLKWYEFGTDKPAPLGVILVAGRHFYYDPQSGTQMDLGESRATDCNTGNFGVGTSLFDW